MKISILGAGRMGSWFAEELCHDHEVSIFDIDKKKMKHLINLTRMEDISELKKFQPELLINAVNLNNTFTAFDEAEKYISRDCIISDITAVKSGIHEYYKKNGWKFVSTHPMFKPTPENAKDHSKEYAVIITESDKTGLKFFRDFYSGLKLNVFDYTFQQHDEITSYTLSVPFISSMVFASCVKDKEAPGTTFHKHLDITRGLLHEDEYVLAEILFNPESLKQIEHINSELAYLTHIIRAKDFEEVHKFLGKLRKNIKE